MLSLLLSELGGHWLTVVACRIWGKIKRPREAENNVLEYLRVLCLLGRIQSFVIRIRLGEVISRLGAWVLAIVSVPVSMRRVMDLKTRFKQWKNAFLTAIILLYSQEHQSAASFETLNACASSAISSTSIHLT